MSQSEYILPFRCQRTLPHGLNLSSSSLWTWTTAQQPQRVIGVAVGRANTKGEEERQVGSGLEER